MSDNFRLSDAQWAAIAPLLAMVHTGPVRQDDRRIISGILHRLREGCRWRALPAEYGPYTTVFNRYNRWSKRGLWQGIFGALASCAEPPSVMMIDSTAVRAHHQDPCPDRPGRPAARVPADRRQHCRYHGRSAAAGRCGGQRLADRRQRLRRRSSARPARQPRHHRRDPQQIEPQAHLPFRRGALQVA